MKIPPDSNTALNFANFGARPSLRRCLPSSAHNLIENSASPPNLRSSHTCFAYVTPRASAIASALCGHPDGYDTAAKSKNDTKENQKNNNILKWASLFRYGFHSCYPFKNSYRARITKFRTTIQFA